MAAKKIVTESPKKNSKKPSDEEQVADYMSALKHPLKKEMEEVRKIIKGVDSRIGERIKWNAPSYYFQQDMVTFGPARPNSPNGDKLLLVFHHPFIVKIKSPLLEGEYKDRRLTYFQNMKEVKSSKKELIRIISELMNEIEG
ncbi:MAG TPA: DUF1801 domain-containing protein [Chryseolinea sp.]|nr:DUF1801 domain-containing protein [Chryseolinea sp.]HPH45942.1 DUF1801 domain-containing protein [Chryseolinea sp.]HPM32117.1 DUF1801 domain-containing protein [Chryseolinea sp.]